MGAKGEPGTPGKPGRTVRGWGGRAGASPVWAAELGFPGGAAKPTRVLLLLPKHCPKEASAQTLLLCMVWVRAVWGHPSTLTGGCFLLWDFRALQDKSVPKGRKVAKEKRYWGGQAMVPGEKPAPGGTPLLSIAPGSYVQNISQLLSSLPRAMWGVRGKKGSLEKLAGG